METDYFTENTTVTDYLLQTCDTAHEEPLVLVLSIHKTLDEAKTSLNEIKSITSPEVTYTFQITKRTSSVHFELLE